MTPPCPTMDHESNTENHPNRYRNAPPPPLAIQKFRACKFLPKDHGVQLPLSRCHPGAATEFGSIVQQAIELRPDLVLLRHRLMTCPTLCERPQLGSRRFWLGMIEVVVPPAAAGLREPLRILDGHVGAVESAGEVTPA